MRIHTTAALTFTLGLSLAACSGGSDPQQPVDSGTSDSSTQTPHDAAQHDAPPQQPDASVPPDGPQTQPTCGLWCSAASNAGCSGGQTCSAWLTGDGTYGSGCFAQAGTAPEFTGTAFHVCHPGSTAVADRCPLGTYCDGGLEVCMTICDPDAGGTPLYPNSPSTSWAVLSNPSCAGAYGDDCKTKDYLHGFTEYCLPYCVNVQ